jgi:two-component system sensor kinase FixL
MGVAMHNKNRVARVARLRGRDEPVRAATHREVTMRVVERRGAPAADAYLKQQIGPVLAHELSQPLTAIANYASACARFLRANDGQSARNALRAVEAIIQEAQRGSEILRRMRSCLVDGNTAPESLELGALLTSVVARVSATASDAGVSIECDGHRGVRVRADSVLVRQVLSNLVFNALDAIRDGRRGPGTIRIVTRMRADAQVEIEVSDDGVGISRKMRELIFEPAFTTKRDGSGMGLTICRSIVEAHGGRLWVEPDRRVGTAFKFTLPAAAEA